MGPLRGAETARAMKINTIRGIMKRMIRGGCEIHLEMHYNMLKLHKLAGVSYILSLLILNS